MNKEGLSVVIGLVGLIVLMMLLSALSSGGGQRDAVCRQAGYDFAASNVPLCVRRVSISGYEDEICEILGMPNGKLIITSLGASAFCKETAPFPE